MERRRSFPAASRVFQTAVTAAATSVLALLVLGCGDRPTEPPISPSIESAAAVITQAALSADVSALAADSMRGRKTPSPELGEAADYIETAFRHAGLQPGGDFGTYQQAYPCPDAARAPANVIALRRGSDPKLADEWVIVSAHYDHVGVGVPDAAGDSVYNGADDNASGTAGLLGVARAFAALDAAPARSVAFVAVSGEELGFVGSWYLVDHRPAAMTNIVADINLDMLGRNAPALVWAIGRSLSSLGATARREAERHPEGLTIQDEPSLPSTYLASDQIAFAVRGIPAILLHTGSHADLHRPSDDLSRLDTDKAARVARLAFRLAYAVATDPVAPSWTTVGDTAVPHLHAYRGICSTSK